MNSRSLVALSIAPMLGLFSNFVFAEKAKKASSPVSCSLYAKGNYSLSGVFSDPYQSDRLVRKGLAVGNGCHYSRTWFRVGMGWEFYKGAFEIDHVEPTLNGSFFFDEIGVKEWVNTALILDSIEISLTAGMEKTATSNLKVKDLYIDFGGGWLNLGPFAIEQLRSNVDLKIWELSLETVFPLNRNLALTFGLLWQNYDVAMQIGFNRHGQDVLEALHYDLGDKKDFKISQNLFYFTPGVKWCRGKKLCASAVVPWGVLSSDTWSLGGAAGVEWKY